MLNVLSEDVIWRIFKYLDVKSRVRIASLNTTFRRLLSKWEDILYCSIRLGGITLAGEKFIIEVEQNNAINHIRTQIVPILKRCPLIRKLAIHDERALRNFDGTVLHQLLNIDELHISCNFFAEGPYSALLSPLLSFPKLHVLHVQQRYNEDKSHLNIVRENHIKQLISTSINNIKLQGVVVTGDALKLLCCKYKNTMESLCLLGALIPTQDLFECFQAINSLESLAYLTLAPSLFSISTSNRTFFHSYPTLTNCRSLKMVALYVSKPDIAELKLLLRHLLPISVQQLLLYDESYRLAYQIEQERKEFECKIEFCRDDEIIIDSYWMNGRSELITHTLWKPPYKTNIFIPDMLPEWYCVLSELMATARLSEYSCRSSSSSSASTAQSTSQADERTSTAHSFRSASRTDQYQRKSLCELQNKILPDCCSVDTAIGRIDSLNEITAHSAESEEGQSA